MLYSDVIDEVSDAHAAIVNRTREASMLLSGQSLLVHDVTPALFAAISANEAERAAPGADPRRRAASTDHRRCT